MFNPHSAACQLAALAHKCGMTNEQLVAAWPERPTTPAKFWQMATWIMHVTNQPGH